MPSLFEPITVGTLRLPNRIVMAPLTRSRATADTRVPVPMMAEYYSQRATAGLIISEATVVDRMGVGYEATPGIWTDEQVEGWKSVTEAVHKAGGRIFLQLWHVGRISDYSFWTASPLSRLVPSRPKGMSACYVQSGHIRCREHSKRTKSQASSLPFAEVRPMQ